MSTKTRLFCLLVAAVCIAYLVWHDATMTLKAEKAALEVMNLKEKGMPKPATSISLQACFEYQIALQLLGDPSVLTFTCPNNPNLQFKIHHLGQGRFEVEQVRGWFTMTQIIRLIWAGEFEGSTL